MRTAMLYPMVLALLVGLAPIAESQVAPSDSTGELHSGDYRNDAFGYLVKIPRGLQYELTRQSSPNQGFLIARAPAGHILVDASITDSELLAQFVAEQEAFYADCKEAAKARATLGRLPASALTFSCPDGVGMAKASTVRMVVALRCQKGKSCIAYRVESFTNSADAKKQAAASIGWLFTIMRRNFSTRPIS